MTERVKRQYVTCKRLYSVGTVRESLIYDIKVSDALGVYCFGSAVFVLACRKQ